MDLDDQFPEETLEEPSSNIVSHLAQEQQIGNWSTIIPSLLA